MKDARPWRRSWQAGGLEIDWTSAGKHALLLPQTTGGAGAAAGYRARLADCGALGGASVIDDAANQRSPFHVDDYERDLHQVEQVETASPWSHFKREEAQRLAKAQIRPGSEAADAVRKGFALTSSKPPDEPRRYRIEARRGR